MACERLYGFIRCWGAMVLEIRGGWNSYLLRVNSGLTTCDRELYTLKDIMFSEGFCLYACFKYPKQKDIAIFP